MTPPRIVDARIEIPMGCRNKYEVDAGVEGDMDIREEGTALLQQPDMADMQVLISSRHNSTTLEGEVSHLHVDMRGASAKLGGKAGHRAELCAGG